MSQFLMFKKLGFETATYPPFCMMSWNILFFFYGVPKEKQSRYVMKQHDQTVNIYLQTSSVTVQPGKIPGKIPGIPQKKIQHCTAGMLGRVLEIIMSTARTPDLYPIFTDRKPRANSPGPVSRRRSPPRRESPLGKGQELTPEKDLCPPERNLSSLRSNCQWVWD